MRELSIENSMHQKVKKQNEHSSCIVIIYIYMSEILHRFPKECIYRRKKLTQEKCIFLTTNRGKKSACNHWQRHPTVFSMWIKLGTTITILLPSLKLTAKPPENHWLQDEMSSWISAYFQGLCLCLYVLVSGRVSSLCAYVSLDHLPFGQVFR